MTYAEKKNRARDRAIQYELEAADAVQTWQEVTEMGAELERIARRYGLVKEFRAEGII